MKQKVDLAIEALISQGHTVGTCHREDGIWFEIDGRMLASRKEMEELGDRVCSLAELEDRFVRRRNQEQRN
jgi:hypothetical protein